MTGDGAIDEPCATVLTGDTLEALRGMSDDLFDAVVTDPPYGLSEHTPEEVRECLAAWTRGEPYVPRRAKAGFMGRTWDAWVPGPECWREVYRVLKPGGHALVFAGSRTSDLMGIALRLAGFEIRDGFQWWYGSGFPKSMDVAKAIDKAAGATREVVGSKSAGASSLERVRRVEQGYRENLTSCDPANIPITTPATDAAKAWDGWGTALKPAHEPIIVARKPLVGTVAENVLAHGTGALHIDACRIATAENLNGGAYSAGGRSGLPGDERDAAAAGMFADGGGRLPGQFEQPTGRWPANVALSHAEDCVCVGTQRVRGDNREPQNGKRGSGFVNVGASKGDGKPCAPTYGDADVERWACVPGCPVRVLDDQSGERRGSPKSWKRGEADQFSGRVYTSARGEETMRGYGDTGGASRFFYTAKASRSDRNTCVDGVSRPGVENTHPTVKPLELMQWLVRLVTPVGGIVLDPFAGSGTTAVSAVREGCHVVAVEGVVEHVAIIRRRLLLDDVPSS